MNNTYLAKGDFVYRTDNPPIIVHGDGVVLQDINGKKYLDAEAANGTSGLGFDGSIFEEALTKVKDIPSIPSFSETELRIDYANKIGKKISEQLNMSGKVAFEIGGAQGMELAMKIVKSNSKKSQFVVFEGGYHGRSAYSSQLSASHRYRKINGDWRIPVYRIPYPDCEQCRFDKSINNCGHECIEYTRKMIGSELSGISVNSMEQDIAAFVFEPVLNAGGCVVPDKEYLETTVRLFRKMGALIIVDEIFTGFYRTGKFLGIQHFDIEPDIIVMSKAIVNGCTPFSCVWAKDPLLTKDNFAPGTHSATYINNTFGLSVAETVFDRYEKWVDCESDIKLLENTIFEILEDIKQGFPSVVKSVNVIGGFGRLLLKDNVAKEILDIALSIGENNPVDGYTGVILASTGLTPNVIAINPALNISDRDLKLLHKILIRVLKKYEDTRYETK